MCIKNGVRKIPPWSIPPRQIPTCVKVRLWVRVRLGEISLGGIHRGGNGQVVIFPVPQKHQLLLT